MGSTLVAKSGQRKRASEREDKRENKVLPLGPPSCTAESGVKRVRRSVRMALVPEWVQGKEHSGLFQGRQRAFGAVRCTTKHTQQLPTTFESATGARDLTLQSANIIH